MTNEKIKRDKDRKISALMNKKFERTWIYVLCEVMEQGVLGKPIAAYSSIEYARMVASECGTESVSLTVICVSLFNECGVWVPGKEKDNQDD